MIEPSSKILNIDSKKSELKKVEGFLKEIFETHNLSDEHFNKVFLCVSEAIINSIVHGNKQNDRKKIGIRVLTKGQNIILQITDEGEGFDIKAIPDPTSKENLKKESGRGIHIIKTISETLEYNQKGNSVTFQIKCQ